MPSYISSLLLDKNREIDDKLSFFVFFLDSKSLNKSFYNLILFNSYCFRYCIKYNFILF